MMSYIAKLDVKKDANHIKKKPRQTFCVRVKRSRNTGPSHQTNGARHNKLSSAPITSQIYDQRSFGG
jgi:hypothetical protein